MFPWEEAFNFLGGLLGDIFGGGHDDEARRQAQAVAEMQAGMMKEMSDMFQMMIIGLMLIAAIQLLK